MNTQAAKDFLEQNFAPWVKALNLRIDAIGPDGATLSMPITPDISRIGGIVSGQALAALADTAMVFACAGHFGTFRPVATTNLDLQFLRPGSGERVVCRAGVVRFGKALGFTRAGLSTDPGARRSPMPRPRFSIHSGQAPA